MADRDLPSGPWTAHFTEVRSGDSPHPVTRMVVVAGMPDSTRARLAELVAQLLNEHSAPLNGALPGSAPLTEPERQRGDRRVDPTGITYEWTGLAWRMVPRAELDREAWERSRRGTT